MRFDCRVTFLRRSVGAVNAFNEQAETWPSIGEAYAARKDISDQEKLASGRPLAERIARFTLRDSALARSLTAEDRLTVAAAVWSIQGVKEAAGGAMIEVTASRISS